jgi:hypothetical protein
VALIILARRDTCRKIFDGSCLSRTPPNREPFQNSGEGFLPVVSYSLRIRSSPPI